MNIIEIAQSRKNVFDLKEGDVIESHGEKLVFLNFKKGAKSFVAQSVAKPDLRYKVRCNFSSEFSVIGKAAIEKIQSEIELLRRSPAGTLFIIQNKKDATLFKLESFSPSGKIKARNPFDNNIFNIDPSFTIKLVSNIR